jgi:hypothetical protein
VVPTLQTQLGSNHEGRKMTAINLLKHTGRAAILALVLAGTAFSAAAPVQAAPLQGFSLDVAPPKGGDQGMLKQFNNKSFGPNDFFNWCLSDKQIRKGLYNYGFDDVEIVGHPSKNRVRVEAVWDEWVYSFRVHRCTGIVDRIKKLYPVWEDDDYDDDDWGPWNKKK